MMRNRIFGDTPVRRLIVSVEMATVQAIDEQLGYRRTYSHGNRSEFVRQAIEEKLQRDAQRFDD
ncbi:MAG: toxin-antitoxin system protein [Porticoccus sp.]|nr:toxin-antitoxin system protein [Porticoccus sp.]